MVIETLFDYDFVVSYFALTNSVCETRKGFINNL